MKNVLKVLLVFLFCTAVFFGSGYYYLTYSLKNGQKTVEEKQENIPYYDPPENCRLDFIVQNGDKLTILLDFYEEIAYIVYINNFNDSLGEYTNYPESYDFNIDFDLFSAIVDRLGGVDIETDDGTFRFTGVQVCDIMAGSQDTEIRREVIRDIVKRVSNRGFSEDDFVCLIENSGSALSLPTCIHWQKYLKSIFKNAVYYF
ncbi:MAG: hypothetical protein IKZ47_03360 [Clostridia bacterium]|nr:hypothetical protein [Clostridia bacterium]